MTDSTALAANAPNTPVRYRPITFGVTHVDLRDAEGGVQYLSARTPLLPYRQTMGESLVHWAQTAPARTLVARRARLADGTGCG
jgi:feruloyl-CoA synthase